MTRDTVNILIAINAGTLVAILIYGYKLVRFINVIEFKTDMMWADFEDRVGHRHRRLDPLKET